MSNLVYYKQEILNKDFLGGDNKNHEEPPKESVSDFPKYVTKIGIQAKEGTKIELNNQEYFIGKTGILEIEDWIITKIKVFANNTEIQETYNTYETISIDKPASEENKAEITYPDNNKRTQDNDEKWELIIQTETTKEMYTPINDQIIIDYRIEATNEDQNDKTFFK